MADQSKQHRGGSRRRSLRNKRADSLADLSIRGHTPAADDTTAASAGSSVSSKRYSSGSSESSSSACLLETHLSQVLDLSSQPTRRGSGQRISDKKQGLIAQPDIEPFERDVTSAKKRKYSLSSCSSTESKSALTAGRSGLRSNSRGCLVQGLSYDVSSHKAESSGTVASQAASQSVAWRDTHKGTSRSKGRGDKVGKAAQEERATCSKTTRKKLGKKEVKSRLLAHRVSSRFTGSSTSTAGRSVLLTDRKPTSEDPQSSAAAVLSAADTTSHMSAEQSRNDGVGTSRSGAAGSQAAEATSGQADAPATAATASPSASGTFLTTAGADGAEADMGRLQALLEARGLPSHFFGALGTLGPRMHQLLHRQMGSGVMTRVQQLLQGLQASSDEGQQLTAVIEMCQVLVMGNEDSLAGFPIKQVVPALVALLQMDNNFDMMHHACRALTYMMEALPRSSAVILDAIPIFLDKLQVIQCMDVAEQSLQALEMLSRRHSKAILHAGGISACLMYVDFFSMAAQRAALAIAANCCQNMSVDEIHFVREPLPLLTAKLTHDDKKCVESVCLCFARLVDDFQADQRILKEIASHGLLSNIQKLLMSVTLMSTATFVMVIHMLVVMCANCPDLAVVLLKDNIGETICYLLVQSASKESMSSQASTQSIELVSRTPQELYEIVCLIGELMPKLPTDGIFCVDLLLGKAAGSGHGASGVSWQWRDDRAVWHAYVPFDNRIIEAAHRAGDYDVTVSTMGRRYTIDLETMQQVNEDTGTTRPIQKKVMPPALDATGTDSRADVLAENTSLASEFIKTLFGVLYEVYSSSAGPSVRHACLQALLRMIYYAAPDLLKNVLKSQTVSSHIAAMMASQDLKVVVSAIQMAHILMQKLPDTFGIYFHREGVMHQVRELQTADYTQQVTPLKKDAPTAASTSCATPSTLPRGGSMVVDKPSPSSMPSSVGRRSAEMPVSPPPPAMRLSDVLKRKKPPKRIPPRKTATSEPEPPPPPSGRRSQLTARMMCRSAQQQQQQQQPSSQPQRPAALPSGSSRVSPRPYYPPMAPHSAPADHPARQYFTFASALNYSTASSSMVATAASGVPLPHLAAHMTVPVPPPQAVPPPVGPGTGMPQAGGGYSESYPLPPTTFHTPPRSSHGMTRSNTSARQKFFGSREGKSSCSSPRSSFLSSLIPSRWSRSNVSSERLPPPPPKVPSTSSRNSANMANNKEKIQTWIREQAVKFSTEYFSTEKQLGVHPALCILTKLTHASDGLASQNESFGNDELAALQKIADIVVATDVSPFEIIHSGLVAKLLAYLTKLPADGSTGARDLRLRRFLHLFLRCPPADVRTVRHVDLSTPLPMSSLVSKLMGCFHHLEQFQVKVHDLPEGNSTTGKGNNALNFLRTHQLKCVLERHPSCSNLKAWKGGPVKIDPLALVQAIERYLVMRGYGRDADDECSDDENSDEDIDDTMAAVSISQETGRHRLEFLIGGTCVPYDMTVYQAIRQYSAALLSRDATTFGPNSEQLLANTDIWVETHVIQYRTVLDDSSAATTSSSSSTSLRRSRSDTARRHSHHAKDSASDVSPSSTAAASVHLQSELSTYLTSQLPVLTTSVLDPSIEVCTLLRVLHALNRHWQSLYETSAYLGPMLASDEFLSSKLTAKANRQLQDPLVILTASLPSWLTELTVACPFLLPFATRQTLFYATAFDRDRALQRLQDSTLDATPDFSDRATPRLERKRRIVSRSDILRQAETVMGDVGSSKTVLEIQYEHEVGTGLGPTLEFYALVSRELQRSDLNLWRGEKVTVPNVNNPGDDAVTYMHSVSGLFFAPVSRKSGRGGGGAAGLTSKMKSKCVFLGKFMAKAVMDFRMVDIPFSIAFFKWLLGKEEHLTSHDLQHVDPVLSRSYHQLEQVLRERTRIEEDKSHTAESQRLALDNLTIDGCSIEDLDLSFVLPGNEQIELKKGGKDIAVTLDSLEEYLKLMVRWMLVDGVQQQLEAVKKGFQLVFPLSHLHLFYPDELDELFCGSHFTSWTLPHLIECCHPDHGYTHDSQSVQFLYDVLTSYTPDEQRRFLQFVTGSPRLPVGGLKSLNPPLTIVRKILHSADNADSYLPSVMTCVNYLKLPDYSSVEVTRERLAMAALEGQLSFHLS